MGGAHNSSECAMIGLQLVRKCVRYMYMYPHERCTSSRNEAKRWMRLADCERLRARYICLYVLLILKYAFSMNGLYVQHQQQQQL